MDQTQNRLGKSSSAPKSCNSIPVPPALTGGNPVGRQFSTEDPAGNLRFHVASATNGNVNAHIPWHHRASLTKGVLTGAKGALDHIDTDSKFNGGSGTGLIIHTLAEFVTSTIQSAVTVLPKDLPGDKPICIFVLCAFNGDVNIFVGEAPSRGRTMDDITRDFLARLERDKKAGGHHVRQIVDDYIAEATAHLLGGEAEPLGGGSVRSQQNGPPPLSNPAGVPPVAVHA